MFEIPMKTLPRALIFLLAAGCFSLGPRPSIASPSQSPAVETIIAIRHGEKPADNLGQLSCRGLNRALALPKILLGRYGRPGFVFAPNPSVMAMSGGRSFSYVRPLATIEPTAVEAHLPVNTQIGAADIAGLQAEITKPAYAHAVVFMAWEHSLLDAFAKQMVKSYGGDPAVVPAWPENDYDSIFVIRLRRQDDHVSVSFNLRHEGLNGRLSDRCPGF